MDVPSAGDQTDNGGHVTFSLRASERAAARPALEADPAVIVLRWMHLAAAMTGWLISARSNALDYRRVQHTRGSHDRAGCAGETAASTLGRYCAENSARGAVLSCVDGWRTRRRGARTYGHSSAEVLSEDRRTRSVTAARSGIRG